MKKEQAIHVKQGDADVFYTKEEGGTTTMIRDFNLNGMKISADSDGLAIVFNKRIHTVGAKNTTIRINNDVLEVQGGDIPDDAIIRTINGAKAFLNGVEIGVNSMFGINLEIVPGNIRKAFGKERHNPPAP